MSVHTVCVRHNFETAHRLPHLGGKCANFHGHSWWVQVAISVNRLSGDATVVEFGAYKSLLRGWIDSHLDHVTMIGRADPLCAPLVADGTKLLVFGTDEPDPELVKDLDWPTVENVAVLLGRVAADQLTACPGAHAAWVSLVRVSETHVNTAEWSP